MVPVSWLLRSPLGEERKKKVFMANEFVKDLIGEITEGTHRYLKLGSVGVERGMLP